MTIYVETNSFSLMTQTNDAQGDGVVVRQINGAVIAQWPHSVSLPNGLAHITQEGLVTYDDQNNHTGHPDVAQNAENGSFTYTLWDGAAESPAYVATIMLAGIAQGTHSATIGANTRAGAGGVPVSGSTITAGDPQGYFEIIGGDLVLSAAGAGQANGLYGLTLDTGASWSVDVLPDTAHVINASQLSDAIEDARPRITAQAQAIVIRDGSVVGGLEENITLNSVIGAGQLSDPNKGASNNGYDDDAQASIAGPHLVIRAETPGGAQIAGRMALYGCDMIKIEGLHFATHVPSNRPAGYNYADNLTGNAALAADYASRGDMETTRALSISQNSSHPLRGEVIVDNCTFGAPAGVDPGRFAMGIWARYVSVAVQNCDFDRVFMGMKIHDVDRLRLHNNLFRNYLEDCVHALYHVESGTFRLEATHNYFLEPMVSAKWAGAHCDGIQLGTGADTRNYSIYYSRNIVAMRTGSYTAGTQAAPVQGGTITHTQPRQTQGFFSNHGGSNAQVSGLIQNNFVLINAFWGIQVDNGNGVEVRKNTVVRDFTSTPMVSNPSEAFLNFKSDCVNCSASNNISGSLTADAGASVAFSGNYAALDSQSQMTNSFGVCFNGPFTFANGAVQFAIDTTSRASTRASIDTLFAPKAGGPGQGKGHLA
jgi:hypothetical protein